MSAGILKPMQVSRVLTSGRAAILAALLLLLSGCRHGGDGFNVPQNAASWNAKKQAARQELTAVPAPAKKAYLAVRREPDWQNPFLSVGRDMIQLRIYLADENDSSLGRGGITRITAARREVLNVRLADLPRALAALPDNTWPYGRVIAVGEGLTNPQDRAQVRHNLEITMHTLDDLGLVVEEWDGPGLEQ